MTDVPRPEQITRTTRDPAELRARLERWLADRHPGAAITDLDAPPSGMSSETLLFEATWPGGGGSFVARMEPPVDAVPVFPSYDLEAQFRVIRLVGERTSVPVPTVRWLEVDPEPLGAPFFVMERVHGRVPLDVMPYTMDGFLLDAEPAERRRLQDRTVDVLAGIHTVPVDGPDAAFLHYDVPGDTALRRHVEHWRRYADWVRGDRHIPVLEAALDWLLANWPDAADQRPPVLSWGDSRIGNVLYDGWEPAAVLDWEMAGIAPREVDLGWMSFLHTFFQDITEEVGLPGLPDMLRLEDVAARYQQASGVAPVDLAWFRVYAAFRHGAVMLRVRDRQEHFGEAEPVDDPDHGVMHHLRLRSLIEA